MELNKPCHHYDKAGNIIATITKTKIAPLVGKYKETSIDKEKKEVDFTLVSCSSGTLYKPYRIQWRPSGKYEDVSKRQLTKLEAKYIWKTDF